MENKKNVRDDKKRNASIEGMRVMLTVGVCLLHVISQGGYNIPWMANLVGWCVAGFVFISGWFGIKFSLHKMLQLYGIGIYCTVCFVLFDAVLCGKSYTFFDFCFKCIREIRHQWFLNAYIVLMCFVPFLNGTCCEITQKIKLKDFKFMVNTVAPLLVCVFGWSFATTLPLLKDVVPYAVGVSEASFLTLIGIYVIARLANLNRDLLHKYLGWVENKIAFCGVFVTTILLAVIGLSNTNSLVAVALASITFYLFTHIKLPIVLCRLCNWLAPSMFSVYILHVHRDVWGYLQNIESFFVSHWNIPIPLMFLLTASVIFMVCVALDMPRRCFILCYAKLLAILKKE